jgi:cell division topological specificity factor
MKFTDLFKKKNSGDTAKDRLKFMLVGDRANCSPELLERIKSDIIEVLSKYAEFDQDSLDIHITNVETDEKGTEMPALYANIPIRNMHHNA